MFVPRKMDYNAKSCATTKTQNTNKNFKKTKNENYSTVSNHIKTIYHENYYDYLLYFYYFQIMDHSARNCATIRTPNTNKNYNGTKNENYSTVSNALLSSDLANRIILRMSVTMETTVWRMMGRIWDRPRLKKLAQVKRVLNMKVYCHTNIFRSCLTLNLPTLFPTK